MRVHTARIYVLLIASLVAARPVIAQGAVSGRVAMQEKPGEPTKDFDATVVYLMPKGAPVHFTEVKARWR